LSDAPPIEIVNRDEEAGRSEPAVIEQSQCRGPILSAVCSKQRGVLGDELSRGGLLGGQRVDMPGRGFAFDGYKIQLDQLRIVEACRRLLADHQIYAVDLAKAFQPRGEIYRVAEQ